HIEYLPQASNTTVIVDSEHIFSANLYYHFIYINIFISQIDEINSIKKLKTEILFQEQGRCCRN
ncbi:MAG: hypothetical protein ACHQXK_09200, partial [Methanosarcina thermophila]